MSAFSLIAILSLSAFTCCLSFGTYLWTSSNILLASFVLSSSTLLLTFVLGFLIMVYQKKTANDEFNICCCNLFNVFMMIIYVMFVGSFLITFGGIINAFVSDQTTQYIIFGAYGLVLLIIIVGSISIACVRKINPRINEIL
ncbi:hypothetical protein Klosneuvirus_4_86 [Klosneuvirus KNV1]|uniref:Uncharacterized protein n=1 Tax=Klosneuvirus KNV1 TaxID=1977640 RepID=A0A1V0SKS5_9VIRU|nr:hypothetical protein Klosneuvirus_4_86 [Klosneuvirus KNV1]